MFSGIIETIGRVETVHQAESSKRFKIHAPTLTGDMHIGDSISVNGVCLTITQFDSSFFEIEAVPETLRCTNLGLLQQNSAVNLERSIRPDQRIGGHFVQGHVDDVCEILSIEPEGTAWLVTLSLPHPLEKYIVNKGYITLDGMSITVIQAGKNDFSVMFIPHTQSVTITQFYQVGQKINIEADMLGKYIAKYLENAS